MEWFRVYSEVITDPKIKRVARQLHRSVAEIVGVWITMLSLASNSPQRGILLLADDVPVSQDDLDDITGVSTGEIIRAFTEMRMIEDDPDHDAWRIVHWNDRQFASDDVSERVRRHRVKKLSDDSSDDSDVTLQKRYGNVSCNDDGNVTVTPPDTDTDTDTEISLAYASERPQAAPPASPIPSDQAQPEKPAEKIASQADSTLSEPVKPARTQARARSPAVVAFHDVTHRWPNAAQETEIERLVTPDALDRWRSVVSEWCLRGYKPTNVRGMLDWLRHGIPVTGGQHDRPIGRQNGHETDRRGDEPSLEEIKRRQRENLRKRLAQEQANGAG